MDKEDALKLLGLKIRIQRERLKLSQTEFANKIGKDQPSINRVEKGNINPSYLYLEDVCQGLEITLPDLLKTPIEY